MGHMHTWGDDSYLITYIHVHVHVHQHRDKAHTLAVLCKFCSGQTKGLFWLFVLWAPSKGWGWRPHFLTHTSQGSPKKEIYTCLGPLTTKLLLVPLCWHVCGIISSQWKLYKGPKCYMGSLVRFVTLISLFIDTQVLLTELMEEGRRWIITPVFQVNLSFITQQQLGSRNLHNLPVLPVDENT